MDHLQNSVLYLRSRSLGARHAILWGGSLVIFFVVSFLWVGQMKHKLATAFQFGPGAPFIASSSTVPQVETPVASTTAPKEAQFPMLRSPERSEGRRQSEAAPPVVSVPSPMSANRNGIVGLIERGTAGLFSLLRGEGFSSSPSPRQEGQELDRFLKYQQEYYRPLPANQ